MMLDLGTIHRKNAAVLALAAVVVSPFGVVALGSLLLGGAIQVLNTRLLERSVSRTLAIAPQGGHHPLAGLVHLRLVGLLALVSYVLVFVSIDVVPFCAGLSIVVPAAIWHGLAAPQEAS